MAKTPSLTALLGLLAVAGYHNRDKIGDLIGKAKSALGTQAQAQSEAQSAGASQDQPALNDFSEMFGESKAGDTLSSGLGDVLDEFKQAGHADTADSWVSQSPNKQLDSGTLQATLGDATLNDIAAKTGLSKADILARLSASLPEAINDFTPEGRLPNASEASRFR